MSIIAMPPGLAVNKQDFGYQSSDLAPANDDTGSSQVEVNGPARWTCALISEDRIPVPADAAEWSSTLVAMNGQVNRMAVYDKLNQAPRGTARGNWVAQVTAARGASSMVINMGAGQAGTTLMRGDWIGVQQDSATWHRQLLKVLADAVADGAGVMTVQFAFVLRADLAAGSAVVWDRPTCLMARTNGKNTWSTQGRSQGGFSMDLVERWA